MTEQDRQLIQDFVTRIQNAPPAQIDREADELIRRSLSRPDAIYLLVQTALIQDMAINQQKAQIDQLKQQAAAPQPSHSSSFLPGGGGSDWGRDPHVQQSAPPPQPQAQPQYSPQAPPPQAPPAQTSGGSSFLRSAATTAAGVIAGETAFSALSSIFGHHEGGGFFGGGSGFLSGAPVSPASETVINNYYEGDDRDRDQDSDRDRDDVSDDDMSNIDDTDDQSNDDDSDYDDDSSSDDDGSTDV